MTISADTRSSIARAFAALLIGAAGGVAAFLLALPVPWLLGPMVAVTIASVLGLDCTVPGPLRTIAFFVLGIQAGSGVTPNVVEQLTLWPYSFAFQMLGVVFITAGTYVYLRQVLKWDGATALFASLPGALSFVVAAAEDTSADLQRMVIVQTARLLLLIGALVPFLAWLENDPTIVPAARGQIGTMPEYLILCGVCAALACLGSRFRLPGGMMLGALIGSAVLHATDVSSVGVPNAISIPCLIVLGGLIGSRIYGIERRALLKLLPISIVCFAIGILFSALAGLGAILLLPLEPGSVALAYAPGALEALTVLAFQFDIDPAYVAAHHVIRFMAIAMIVPLLATKISKRQRRMAETPGE